MPEVNFLQSLHTSSKRDYFARMNAEKPDCMRVAMQYGAEYWDGDRKYGYGGYKYDGRWKPIAHALIKHYKLKDSHSILDIGCGKGHLLSEIKNHLKWVKIRGCDISEYALRHIPPNLSLCTKISHCSDLPYSSQYFDFSYSIGCFHNLDYSELKRAIREMVRVTKETGKSYICVESYRNPEELCNLQMWALTCQSFYTPQDWQEIFADNGYTGDHEFIYFT